MKKMPSAESQSACHHLYFEVDIFFPFCLSSEVVLVFNVVGTGAVALAVVLLPSAAVLLVLAIPLAVVLLPMVLTAVNPCSRRSSPALVS